MQKKYEITPDELRAVVALYRLGNPFMTPARIFSRWQAGKINLLKDYRIWKKSEFMRICKEKDEKQSR